MDDRTKSIEAGYAQGGALLGRIVAALEAAGIDPARPRASDLFSIDQIHGRGLAATGEHVGRAGITRDMHVLDVGCGIGGVSRYLASVIGCRVTGIDLTHEFVDVARELTARCGLSDTVAFERADAVDLPFGDARFDHALSHNVTMNIADKAGFAVEIARVLRPGGTFSCSEYARGAGGDAIFPTPWATVAEHNFLVTPDEMRAALESGGLRVREWLDHAALRHAAEEETASATAVPPSPVRIVGMLGEDHELKRSNSARNVAEARTIYQFILAMKA